MYMLRIDGLEQQRRNSIANTMELLFALAHRYLSTKHVYIYIYIYI